MVICYDIRNIHLKNISVALVKPFSILFVIVLYVKIHVINSSPNFMPRYVSLSTLIAGLSFIKYFITMIQYYSLSYCNRYLKGNKLLFCFFYCLVSDI